MPAELGGSQISSLLEALPGIASVLRSAAARRCDTALVVARAAQSLEPDNVRGPLVVGACQEQAGRYDEAIATYQAFAAQHPRARGVAALSARAELALRTSAEQTARQALARETELAQEPPQAATVAVLPVLVSGDSTYRPLSRGLAELITTDLAYIRTLKLLERLQIGVLLDELKLGTSQRAAPATAARVGRLLRAERMVQGTVTIPSTGAGSVRLTASVVTGAGVIWPVAPATGPLPQLLGLEKQVVFGLAAQLGIALTEAERQRILKEGPRNLAAFLAYSRGLEAMDAGDYSRAAFHFGEAARVDPSFRAASQQPRADLATARSGVILDAYSFGSGFAFDNVVEWTVPVTVSQHVGQRLTVDLSAAFARASGATTSGNFRVSGFTDTDVRASWATGSGHLILAVAATLPTGQETVSDATVPLLSALAP